MSRKCWTCDTVLEDAAIVRCQRVVCTAKGDVDRAMTSEQRKRYAAEREEQERMRANPAPSPWYVLGSADWSGNGEN